MGKQGLGDIESAFAFFEEQEEDETSFMNTVLRFQFCGIERCLPGHGYGPEKSDGFLIHCILDGHGVFEYRGEKHRLERGQAFLIYPDEDVYYQADYSEPWKYCWVSFRGGSAETVAQEIGFTRGYPICRLSDVDEIEESIRGILSHRGDTRGERFTRAGFFLCTIAAMLCQGREQGARNGEEIRPEDLQLGTRAYTAEAIHYLETHFREKIRIQDLAHEIGISRSYLTQQVKEAIGISPRTLLINIRMEHAARYLTSSNDPIQLVALECGYDDALAFSKAFKARYGMSPSEYRKKKRGGAE